MILQVNIHSINCKIDVSPKKDIYDLEIYSLEINSVNNRVNVTPLIDTLDGVFKENYTIKYCPITINSYFISNEEQQKLMIENKEENVLFFDRTKDNIIKAYYDKIDISINSFVALYLRFEDSSFDVNVSYTTNNNNKKSEPIKKSIDSSTIFYLDNKFLLYNYPDDNSGTVSIIIKSKNNKEYKGAYLFFKIIEDDNICLLDRNDLNIGFITSKSTYQYYHAEILP